MSKYSCYQARVSLPSYEQSNRLCCASQVMNSSSHYRKSLERERNLLMTKADNYGKSFIKNGPSGLDGISAAAQLHLQVPATLTSVFEFMLIQTEQNRGKSGQCIRSLDPPS